MPPSEANAITITDCRAVHIPPAGRGSNRLVLNGVENGDCEVNALQELIASLKERSQIESVTIRPSCRVPDCSFLRAIPQVKAMTAEGASLQSLLGVEGVPGLERLILSSKKQNALDLGPIRTLSLRYLRIVGPRSVDIADIGQCTTLQRLELVGGDYADLDSLAPLALQDMACVSAKIKKLADLDLMRAISSLHLIDCRSFEGFSDNCGKLSHLIIESCNSFDSATLANLSGLQTLTVLNCRQPIGLSALGPLGKLRELNVTNCKDVRDVPKLSNIPSLTKVWISKLAKQDALELSTARPDIKIADGKKVYIGGEPRSLDLFYS